MTTTPAKRGRKQRPYIMRDGTPVSGLYHCPDGRWRIVATGQKFSEPDEKRAVAKFHRLQAEQNRREALVEIPVHSETDPDIAGAVDFVIRRELGPGEHRAAGDDSYVLKIPDNADPIAMLRSIPEHALWAYVADEIIRRPQYVAQVTGIEQIGYLTSLTKPVPSPTLDEVGELYFTKADIEDKWCRQSRLFWREFVDSVGVATLRELTQELTAGYKSDVLENANSPTYVKHRFGQVKTIINYSKQWGKWVEDRARALAFCSILIPPTSTTIDPHPISKDDFNSLYKAAGVQMKAILLLALNCCMYAAEVSDILWADLNLDAGVLVMDRGKTKVARVAVLWPETVAAIRSLTRVTDRLFITDATKQAHNANTIGKAYRELRTAAKVDEAVKFRDIRDGSYTTACEAEGVQYEHARILAGHRTGMSDHYVKRRPTIVQNACEAIRREYLGA